MNRLLRCVVDRFGPVKALAMTLARRGEIGAEPQRHREEAEERSRRSDPYPRALPLLVAGIGILHGAAWGQQPLPYFQQEVSYSIDVELDDEQHELNASETVVYTNRSSVSLDTLWFHLYPNAYKRRGTALSEQQALNGELDLLFAKDEDRGYIDSLDFRTETGPIPWGFHAAHIDIAWLKLSSPLQPNASVTIHTPFRLRIPDGKFSRLGHTGQAYYITQWYPKPAVFDNQGWHAMPYLDQGEFFSDFGSFDVRITLPQNYVVGATGELQNADERAWMEQLAQRQEGKGIDVGSKNFPLSAPNTKTLRFVQDSVLDFAWFADKRYLVEKSKAVLPNGRAVDTWTLYTPGNAEVWLNSVSYVDQAVLHYSKWVGDYPYNVCTAVDGTISAGGGMEYPMITVIGETGSKAALDEVIAHEVGHNWFQGILASDERTHPWMDEGMNSFVELRYMRERYPGAQSPALAGVPSQFFKGGKLEHRALNDLGYRLNARRNMDQPCSLTSEEYTSTNYGTSVYMKTALAFDHLFAYLGDSLFDACMHEYYRRWAFKHPRPDDVQRAFEDVSGRDLSWCFKGTLTNEHKYDPRATKLKDGLLHTRGRAPTWHPFPVTGWNRSDSLGTYWMVDGDLQTGRSSESAGAAGTQLPRGGRVEHRLPWPNVTRASIDAGHRTLDIDHRNNTVRGKGILRSWTPVRVKWLAGLEDPNKRTLFWTPIIASTVTDGFQIGLAFYNTVFPSQRTEFVFAPLYGSASGRLVGAGRIEHHFDRLRSSWFRNIHVGVSGRTAGLENSDNLKRWYGKVSPSIRFDIKRPLAKPTQHSLSARSVCIERWATTESEDPPSTSTAQVGQTWYELKYDGKHIHTLGPASWSLAVVQAYHWSRVQLEVNKAFVYDARKHSVRLRLFAGSFIGAPEVSGENTGWNLSWDADDPMLDNAYIGRETQVGLWANQFSKQQGAFKTGMWQGGSSSYIAAVNAELDLPVRIPLALFASAGWVPVGTQQPNGSRTEANATLWEMGIGLPLIKNVLEIWMPLAWSESIATELDFRKIPPLERIRFVLALEKLDPTRALRNMKP